MAHFDNYIFDSQFLFLNEQQKLREAYEKLVSKSITENLGLKACIITESWDSDKFKKKIGRLLWLENNVSSGKLCLNIIEKLKIFDCCYIRLNAEHSFCNYAEQNNISFQSSKVSQYIDLKEHYFIFDNAIKYIECIDNIEDKEEIIAQVLTLSENSFIHNRFRADTHFSDDQINDIYRSWVINEIKSKESQLFLITEQGKVASFFLYRENISPLAQYKIGFVSLIASSPEFKEKKYASNLLNFVLNKAKTNKTDYVIANTEKRNINAIYFFSKNNFSVTSHLNEYHIWS